MRDIFIRYVPHGMNSNWYHPIEKNSDEWKAFEEFKKDMLSKTKMNPPEFVLLWINRNIRRKQPGDVILSYKMFCDTLTKEQASKCVLIMHTQPVDDNGTDLPAVKNAICPDYNVLFSTGHYDEVHMNFLHNIADVTINISNNEGFGLTTCESLAAGTPIIVNVTGGLQDQCNFTKEGKPLTADDYVEIGSLHDWRKWENIVEWGEWVTPVWPRTRSLNGSPPTPYIFDDRVDVVDVVNAISYWYKLPKEERERRGLSGCNWVTNGHLSQTMMCNAFSNGIDELLESWTPLPRFEVYKIGG